MKKTDIPNVIYEVKNYFLNLQHSICESLAAEDGSRDFELHPWKKKGFGEGITRVISNGDVFEKGGVNFSHVYGDNFHASATEKRQNLEGCPFQVLGVSLVIHPKNPYVPTSHANVRLFIAEPENSAPIWWFGGGYDLTPYYGFEEDCRYWHQTAKNACSPLGDKAYADYKKWCDEYFYLKHRQEPRGIGGLFFDDLNQPDFNTCFSFVRSVGNSYIKAYRPIVEKRKNIAYTNREKQFQLYRRGRYVEFNLLYDRGTQFGLQSNGRIESILMSMPPLVQWTYNWKPESNSAEERLYRNFLRVREWI